MIKIRNKILALVIVAFIITLVTAVVIKVTSAAPTPEKIYEMKVNRQFLFILRSQNLPEDFDFLFMSKIEKLE